MNATTALVFGLLALLLAGPVPALLSRSTWPYRAPRAALVLWQAVAIAAVLSAFSSGLAIASQLLVPGADGRPTTAPTAEIDALGLPLWILLRGCFCPDASDRREADLLDNPGRCENPTSAVHVTACWWTFSTTAPCPRRWNAHPICGYWTSTNRSHTACQVCVNAWFSVKALCRTSIMPRSKPS